jgi:hypothetical protein
MKSYLLIPLISLLFFTACSKRKNCCVLPKNERYITASKNNKDWTANPSISTMITDTIGIFGSNFSTQLEETITMQFKLNGTGKYELKGRQALYYNTVGRDAITSEYQLDDTYNNTVTVLAIDKLSNVITGTFNLKFKHIYPADKPDSLQFLNGKFKVALHN